MVINKISLPSMITLRKPHLFEPNKIELPIVLKVSPYHFLDQFDKECILDEVDENNIKFISDLTVMTFFHYMAQPKSMHCRRLIKKFIEESYGNFDYNWLPKCFGNINN